MAPAATAGGKRTINNKPPPYQKLTRCQFVGRDHAKQQKDEVSICKCVRGDSPSAAAASAQGGKQAEVVSVDCGEDCLNYCLNIECHPQMCPCGDRCQNQRLQRRQNAPHCVKETPGRGWGLYATEDTPANTFVVEYIGEVVTDEEAQARLARYEAEGEEHFYVMNLSGKELIDATRKASTGRYINHSCEPNCVTRKTEVLGELRIGIYTNHAVAKGEELTYDYNMEWFGGRRIKCLCGTPSCVGFLGAKSKRFKEEEFNKLFGDCDWQAGTDGKLYAVATNVDTYDSSEEEDGQEGSAPEASVPESACTVASVDPAHAANHDSNGESLPIVHLPTALPKASNMVVETTDVGDTATGSLPSQGMHGPRLPPRPAPSKKRKKLLAEAAERDRDYKSEAARGHDAKVQRASPPKAPLGVVQTSSSGRTPPSKDLSQSFRAQKEGVNGGTNQEVAAGHHMPPPESDQEWLDRHAWKVKLKFGAACTTMLQFAGRLSRLSCAPT